jgi:hypothetical protein
VISDEEFSIKSNVRIGFKFSLTDIKEEVLKERFKDNDTKLKAASTGLNASGYLTISSKEPLSKKTLVNIKKSTIATIRP